MKTSNINSNNNHSCNFQKSNDLKKIFEWSYANEKKFNAYKEYTNSSKKINTALRSNSTDDLSILCTITNLDKLFETLPQELKTQTDLKVYRGMPLTKELSDIIEKKSSTKIFTDKGFVSTSAKKQVAKIFANNKGNGIIMSIKIPKGSTVIDNDFVPISAKSFMEVEEEVLLPRNSQFKILSYDPKTRIVEAVYAGQKQPLTMPEYQEYTGRNSLADLNKLYLKTYNKN